MKIYKKFLQFLFFNEFIRNVTIIAGGTAISQIILMVVSPVLTRVYSPEDYGIFAVYSAIISILTVISSLRYNLAIPLPKYNNIAFNLVILSVIIVLGISLFIVLLLCIFGEQTAVYLKNPLIKGYLWLLPIGVLFSGWYQVFNYWLIRKKLFFKITQIKVAKNSSKAFLQILLGFIKVGPLGLILGTVFGDSLAVFTIIFGNIEKRKIVNIDFKKIFYVMKRYKRFPMISTVSSLFNNMGLVLPTLFLSSMYGFQVVGWFSLVQRVFGIPINMISNSVAQVYLGELPKLIKEDSQQFYNLFKQTIIRLLFFGIIPVSICILGGPILFSFIFGEKWGEAGLYIRLLSPMYLLQFIVVPVAQTLNIVERQDLQFVWDTLRFILVLGIFIISKKLNLLPITTLFIYSIGMCLTYIILLGIVYYIVLKIRKKRL